MPLYTFRDVKQGFEVTIFFIHIPKCGGTTVERFFEHLNADTFLAPKDYMKVRQYLRIPPAHLHISLIENLFLLEKIYSFAIVRNPYLRMLSDYHWSKTKTNNTEYFQKMSFEDFCTDSIRNFEINNTYLANHITPQHKFISKNVNKVFKLEDGLENALLEVFKDNEISISREFNLPKINSSPRHEFAIGQKTKDIIYDFYKEDFEVFGYPR